MQPIKGKRLDALLVAEHLVASENPSSTVELLLIMILYVGCSVTATGSPGSVGVRESLFSKTLAWDFKTKFLDE